MDAWALQGKGTLLMIQQCYIYCTIVKHYKRFGTIDWLLVSCTLVNVSCNKW